MISRTATILVVIGAIVGVACVDMSAPKGPASISALQLPSPSVVIGDVMRDSLGAPAKLGVIAYDANGARLTDVAAQFFVTDTAAPATVNLAGIVTGTKSGTVHVVGQIGALQTPPAAIPITVAPTQIAPATATITPLEVQLSVDSAVSDSKPVDVTVTGAGGVGAAGFIVKYKLVKGPTTKSPAPSKTPAVFLADDQGKPSTVDTTDAPGGHASRKIVVIAAFLSDSSLSLLANGKSDSVVVTAETSYKGVLVAGSPVRMVIPLVGKFP